MDGLLLTPSDVLRLLGRGKVGRNRLYGWLKAGRLPAVRCGGRYFIARAALERLVEQIARGEWPDEPDRRGPRAA